MERFARFTIDDLEFMAEDEFVDIVCLFQSDPLVFVSGTFGPFEVHESARVPLWLALKLKRDQKCRIKTPAWMTEDALRAQLALELSPEHAGSLAPIPPNTFLIASLILKSASEDVEDAEVVRQLLKEVEDVRNEKLRRGRQSLFEGARGTSTPVVIGLANLTPTEAQSLRGDFLIILNRLTQLERAQVFARQRAEDLAAQAATQAAALLRSGGSVGGGGAGGATGSAPRYLGAEQSGRGSGVGGDGSGGSGSGSGSGSGFGGRGADRGSGGGGGGGSGGGGGGSGGLFGGMLGATRDISRVGALSSLLARRALSASGESSTGASLTEPEAAEGDEAAAAAEAAAQASSVLRFRASLGTTEDDEDENDGGGAEGDGDGEGARRGRDDGVGDVDEDGRAPEGARRGGLKRSRDDAAASQAPSSMEASVDVLAGIGDSLPTSGSASGPRAEEEEEVEGGGPGDAGGEGGDGDGDGDGGEGVARDGESESGVLRRFR